MENPASLETKAAIIPHEQLIEHAIKEGMDTVERLLGTTIEEASPEERIAVTSELLEKVNDRADNLDRFVAEFYAGLRQLAELELKFHSANQKFNALY